MSPKICFVPLSSFTPSRTSSRNLPLTTLRPIRLSSVRVRATAKVPDHPSSPLSDSQLSNISSSLSIPDTSSSERSIFGLPFTTVLIALCSLCGLLNYADRVNMSVTIISLSAQYGLDVAQRGLVMSSFFWGYVPSQITAAVLSRRIGGKRVLAVAATGWSLFTALTPIAAAMGMNPLILCRILMGFFEGMAFPAVYHMFAEWIPENLRGTASSFFHAGVGMGTTVALVISPLIIRNLSWQAVFYIFGGAGILWLAAWLALARDGNASDATKSQENNGTNTNGVHDAADEQGLFFSRSERQAIGYMLQNPVCLAQIGTQLFYGLFHYTIISWLPTYFAVVFNLSVTEVWFTFVPYLASTLATPIGGLISDYIAKKTGSRTFARKATSGFACMGAGIMVVVFASISSNVAVAIAAISGCTAIFALNAGGFDAAYLDIAEPEYAGLMKSVANTLGAASGAIAVSVSTMLLQYSGSWRFVFAAQSVWVILATILFVGFGSAEMVLTKARIRAKLNTD